MSLVAIVLDEFQVLPFNYYILIWKCIKIDPLTTHQYIFRSILIPIESTLLSIFQKIFNVHIVQSAKKKCHFNRVPNDSAKNEHRMVNEIF